MKGAYVKNGDVCVLLADDFILIWVGDRICLVDNPCVKKTQDTGEIEFSGRDTIRHIEHLIDADNKNHR